MTDNTIEILHVFQDGLIFKGVADAYDSMQDVNNHYYFFTPDKDYVLQNLNDPRVIVIRDIKQYQALFNSPTIDVILFHSLPSWNYYLFNYIDKDKYVVWWAWGYDIYSDQGKYPPLISLDNILKPLTKEFVSKYYKNNNYVVTFLVRIVKDVFNVPRHMLRRLIHKNMPPKARLSQDEILKRIDAFYSPLEIEYDLMRNQHMAFTAKRFPTPAVLREIKFEYKEHVGNILVNHSLTHTDNHLDVFDILYQLSIGDNRKYIIPVSYGIGGNYKGNPDLLINASRFDKDQVIWLKKTLPFNEYSELLDTASHAVFGAIRQQAVGNIFMCLRTGMKVYLYRDSIIYKELIKYGYICFTIEDDLTTESLSSCLSAKEARYNYELYLERMKDYSPKISRDFLVNELRNRQKTASKKDLCI